MKTKLVSPARRHSIRFSRTLSLSSAIAIGSSITVGLGIFILAGLLLQQLEPQTPWVYMMSVALFLPFVLTYAERATIMSGSGGAYGLARSGGSTWRTYTSGWLLLGGHLTLIALLAWGAALYAGAGLYHLLNVSIDMLWLAPTMVFLVAINDLLGTHGGWRPRKLTVYGGILFLLIIIVRSWFIPAPGPSVDSTPGIQTVNLVQGIAMLAASLWGIHFVLDSRDEIRQPEHTLLPALLIPLLIGGILGALVAAAELAFSPGSAAYPLSLAARIIHTSLAGHALLETLSFVVGVLVCLVALDRAMVTLLRLVGAMVRDGFLPERLSQISPGFGTPLFALHLFAIGSALVAVLVPTPILVGLVALTFLWTASLYNLADVLRIRPRPPASRPLKLPFYPFFHMVAASIGLFLSLALSPIVLLIGAGWLLLGVLYYTRYARQRAVAVRKRDAVVGDFLSDERKTTYTVLVCVANPDNAPSLIRSGAVLARARKGQVLVLQVAVFPDQMPQHLQRQQAEEQWRSLQTLARDAGIQDVLVDVLVRLAHSPIDGILGTAQEENADLILLGWEGENAFGSPDPGPLLDPVVRAASRDVVVLRGCLPDEIRRILVPTSDSPNSLAALKLACNLAGCETGHVRALNLIQEVFSPRTMDDTYRRLQAMVNSVGNAKSVELRIDSTEDVTAGIVREAEEFDLLLMGASRGGMLDQAIFGGLPVEVARSSPRPVLLVKHYEGARRFWARRAWETLSAPFPSLTLFERTEIDQQMRRAAHPSIDFFILIGLASMIATLGLVLNSPAVIIGAMLVAPLMSPILSMAMSIIKGDLLLLRIAARSTLSGVGLAVLVSIVVAFLAPTYINTSEILARTQPNLLDLLVALASGAAGGYAAARKEVAAALPGVAIAAALVPPLGVVGYGTATGQINIAGGSLLLFTTNLIAIVVAAAAIFLLLGFRPPQARLRSQVRLKLLVSLVALMLISIPLAAFSVNTIDQISRQNRVEAFLNEEVSSDTVRVTDVLVEHREQGVEVWVTIYSLEDFASGGVMGLEERLSAAVGGPVTLHATVLKAMMLPERGNPLLPTPTPLP